MEEHCRENLALVDARGMDKAGKLAHILDRAALGRKMIVYVNSRALTEEISQALQDNLPMMQNKIGYYHGGLFADARQRAEASFRDGDWDVLVSTSAFGEGTDIPDIRDVALYHLCFSRAEYNQLSGRAGRDGEPAIIHLLYSENDVEVNRRLLREEAPDRDALGSFYLLLREKAAAGNPLALSDMELASEMAQRGFAGFSEKTAGCCLGILEEISLLLREDEGGRRDIHLAPPPPAKLDLTQSSLYMEGLKGNVLFDEYLDLAFSPDMPKLLEGINRPILPERRRDL
jgi:single-stranded-DNA-specific exonuclease